MLGTSLPTGCYFFLFFCPKHRGRRRHKQPHSSAVLAAPSPLATPFVFGARMRLIFARFGTLRMRPNGGCDQNGTLCWFCSAESSFCLVVRSLWTLCFVHNAEGVGAVGDREDKGRCLACPCVPSRLCVPTTLSRFCADCLARS